jgi:hypothetical protein
MRRTAPYRLTAKWGELDVDTVLFLTFDDDRLLKMSDELGNWFSTLGVDSVIEERTLVPVDEEHPSEGEHQALEAEAARVEVQQAADRIIGQLDRRPGLAEAVFRRLAQDYHR